MRSIQQLLRHALELTRAYPVSLCGGVKNRALFAEVESYCMFLGFPRSGHSLIGSLLDAHPEMVIAHEVDALKYIYARFGRLQLYDLLLRRARQFAAQGCVTSTYTYAVAGQWQGKFDRLRIIGDKKGESTTLRLRACPWLLPRLQQVVKEPIKVIQISRNPFDNISSIAKIRRLSLADSVAYYFSLCETVVNVRQRLPEEHFFDLQHEAFIADPKASLQALCGFLGLAAPDDYLADCARIVFQAPRKTHTQAAWDRALVEQVQARLESFSFLRGYTYID